ncbi:Heterokaryon incompatibility protein (HET) domain containing protein [Naviculisporaceae sp. PSN 640]
MRLINTATLTLEEFNDVSQIPPYAILSHTWGTEEIAYETMIAKEDARAAIINKQGYQKIANFCKLARFRNLQYGWVDTCCIDKRSSAELSEAINSMYRYYSDAFTCIIYLADVAVDPAAEDRYLVLESIRRSRWLSRGWTLQELIAPFKREFYDTNWKRIVLRGVDDEKELLEAISQATGIPTPVLDMTKPLRDYCVAERMCWASKRQTTRDEDMAYCLMGIFDVNMPIIYGEGGRKAFKRLQSEIMQSSFDQTLFAWRGDYEESGLLANSPSDFANTPPLSLWRPRYLAPYHMTNVGLSIQVLDVTNDGDPARVRELAELGLMPQGDIPAGILAVLQCNIPVEGQEGDREPGALGVCLDMVDASFRSMSGAPVRGYRRICCWTFSTVPARFLSDAPFKDVLVLEDTHDRLLRTVAGKWVVRSTSFDRESLAGPAQKGPRTKREAS